MVLMHIVKSALRLICKYDLQHRITSTNKREMEKFKVIYEQPVTIGFWRPIEVEIGFIQDYINRSLIITDDFIIG